MSSDDDKPEAPESNVIAVDFNQKKPETPPAAVSFIAFARAVQQGDQIETAAIIKALLGLDQTTATDVASHFMALYLKDADLIPKTQKIRLHIMAKEYTDALMLIYHCFGLQGPVAIACLEKMRQLTTP